MSQESTGESEAESKAFKERVRQAMDSKGIMNSIRAHVRAQAFLAMQDPVNVPPRLSNANLLINELLREYMDFNDYNNASSVLVTESGQPAEPPFSRAFMAKELNFEETRESRQIPLLYSLVAGLQQRQVDSQDAETTSG